MKAQELVVPQGFRAAHKVGLDHEHEGKGRPKYVRTPVKRIVKPARKLLNSTSESGHQPKLTRTLGGRRRRQI